MTTGRSHGLIDPLAPHVNPEADWRSEAVRAHAAALTWVRQTTGSYPAPPRIADQLREAADELKSQEALEDPHGVLIQVAVRCLSEGRFHAA